MQSMPSEKNMMVEDSAKDVVEIVTRPDPRAEHKETASSQEKDIVIPKSDESPPLSPSKSDDDSISLPPPHTTTSIDSTPTQKQQEEPTLTRTTSVTPNAVVIPRRQRRGLFGTLTLIPEFEDSTQYARKTKWLITVIVALCAMAGPMGSAIVMPVLANIAVAFNASSTVANMSVATYMLSMAIFPLWWSSFSETAGRRTIYIISFALFTLFAVLSAVATSIEMLIVMRLLSGGAAASVQAVGAGSVADMWESRERGKAMSLFYMGPLCGPLIGPILGGILGRSLGWRSTQWFLVVYGGLTLIGIIFSVPETLRATPPPPPPPSSTSLVRTSTQQSIKNKSKSLLQHLRRIFIDPLTVLQHLRHPPVALTVYYASITFGALYVLNISIQATFSQTPYRFSTLIVGLLYIPGSVGYVLASIFGGRWIDHIMLREARKAERYDEKGKLILIPEDRMKENAWVAAFLYPCALIVYGWTAQEEIFWLVPMIANFFFGVGCMLIFAVATTMLTEFMPKRASSGIAISNFVRNVCSFTGAVVAEPVIRAIGNGWLMTILGVWCLVSGVIVIWAMSKFGPRWRGSMVKALG